MRIRQSRLAATQYPRIAVVAAGSQTAIAAGNPSAAARDHSGTVAVVGGMPSTEAAVDHIVVTGIVAG